MVHHDGNGWIRCAQGHRHWGRFGAAGMLACAPDPGGQDLVLLQRRSWWGNHGGTWGPPGGARDSHESAVSAALREAAEECAIQADVVSVRGLLRDDHGGWAYHTVLAAAPAPFDARPASAETSDVAWVPVRHVARLPLHPGFAGQWPLLRDALPPLTIIVDAANVMGSRPDGWWRDRAAAAARLGRELAGLAETGVSKPPETMRAPDMERWFPDFILVVEGAARSAAAAGPGAARPGVPKSGAAGPGAAGLGTAGRSDLERPGLVQADPVRIVAAEGSGDETIARLAGLLPGRRLVVTADRELRARCLTAGASVTGPRWLLGLLRPSPPETARPEAIEPRTTEP